MTSDNSPNLHPIPFKKDIELDNEQSDISGLFQTTNNENAEDRSQQSLSGCSWLMDPELVVYKLFYFFFYAATALFAYLPLYYKNSLLLDHHHVGILMGIRPFCAFLGAPVLGSFADKFNKYKSMLFTGLLTYVIVYLSITFVSGVPKTCGNEIYQNNTNSTQRTNEDLNTTHAAKRIWRVNEKDKFSQFLANMISQRGEVVSRNHQKSKSYKEETTRLNWKRFNVPLYYKEDPKHLPQRKVVFRKKDESMGTHGDDTAEFKIKTSDNNVTEETDNYDQYWLNAPETAGEDTWPIDVYRKDLPENRQDEDKKTRFHIFLTLLLLMLTADLIGSPILSLADTATLQSLRKQPYKYGHQFVWAAVGFGIMSIVTGSVLHYTVSEKVKVKGCPEEVGERYKPVFYSCCGLLLLALFTTLRFRFRTYEGKETTRCSFLAAAKYFNNVEYLLFAFLAFFTGLGTGLTESFLFVHLIRLGATPLILVVTTAVQSVSRVIFFTLSPILIVKYGYFPIIYGGMMTSVITFLYYSFLVSPWMVVPIEILSGISYSCVWAALVSYVGAPPKIGATLQGILHALHIGLGRGIGGLFGGMILLHYGFDILFRSFSLLIVVIVIVVSFIRHHRQEDVEPIWSKLWEYSPVAPYDALYEE